MRQAGERGEKVPLKKGRKRDERWMEVGGRWEKVQKESGRKVKNKKKKLKI